MIVSNTISWLFGAEKLRDTKKQFIQKAVDDPTSVNKKDVSNLESMQFLKFQKTTMRFALAMGHALGYNLEGVDGLLKEDREIQDILKIYNKISQLDNKTAKNKLPFVFIADKLDKVATQYQFKALKAEVYSRKLSRLQNSLNKGFNSPAVKAEYLALADKQRKLLRNIAEIYSAGKPEEKKKYLDHFEKLLERISKMNNAEGQNVIQQLYKLYVKKEGYYSELAKLHVIKQQVEKEFPFSSIKKEVQSLNPETLAMLKIDLAHFNALDGHFIQNITKAKAVIEKTFIKHIDDVLEDLLNKVTDDLSIYEVSTQRLTEEFSPTVLSKPIQVTMIGVEYAGFVKEGGLAEALEGMTKAMKAQHPGNQVRMIFPKFNILPKNIQDKIDAVKPKEYTGSNGRPYQVYTVMIDGIEYDFIDHPLFVLKGAKPTIYGPDDQSIKARFAAFSGLAADFVKEVKTDVIHLHDWHVAGVALKLYQNDPKGWGEGKVPPIVFTYHNNSRAAQGRFGQGIYNYAPIIQGLLESGVASENINAFVEVMKKADAVTTVSETFGIESQDMSLGEGVSFAAREAAEAGKLTGIVNGSNPHSWNPEKDVVLKNWKDKTGRAIDLTYGPLNSPEEIMNKKELCKVQLKDWIAEYFPHAKIDFKKPIVTYVGRLDSYQKGLDKLEEAIKETIKNGGQFIVMGSLEDDHATTILNQLEAKYKKDVLFIRDYKDPNGRYHFQQGNDTRPGCGSLVRAASDFLLIPSRFEPCGLVQFEGWLFGSLAIGSRVGGLADTIVSPKKNAQNFNGFLFDRDDQGKNSMGQAFKEALTTWSKYTKTQKGTIVRRLMEEGRKYSWSTSPSGYSPIEKYRFVYENARKFAARRKKIADEGIVNIQARLSKVRDQSMIRHHKANEYSQIEEAYQTLFYSKKANFKTLEEMYNKLPESLRLQVPSPYGRQVNAYTYETLGAHIRKDGIQFTVEAPNAKQVQLKIVTDKEEKFYPLTKSDQGKWTGFVPALTAGTKYQYLIDQQVKLDPVGLQHVAHPVPGQSPCSVVVDRKHDWQDKEWMQSRIEQAGKASPTSIYELHPMFWKKKNDTYLNYREIADELVKHCQMLGYTHVELMGILEHPDERSWGYQVTGFFAPNSRMGTSEDFKYLVDTLHKNKIGVYLDWVPAHFAKDKYALAHFDGSNQYQPSEKALSLSLRYENFKKWGTHFFDFRKKSVRDFLTSSATYWLKEMHVDGLRVDAVKCMLLSEDPQSSRLFLKDLNTFVHKEFPGCMMMAEDYLGDFGLTQSTSMGGLGFDQKWNISWMSNTLKYFSLSPAERLNSYNKIVNAINKDTFHKMILAISHDEVKMGMKSLIEKTPTLNPEEKFANLRAFFGFLMGVPGKKLMFMGNEFGTNQEWDSLIGTTKGIVDTQEKKLKSKQVMACVQRLNTIYKTYKPFWQHDYNAHDLTWIEKDDPQKKIHAYRRTSDEGESIACLHNFSNDHVQKFVVMFKNGEIFDHLQEVAQVWKIKHEEMDSVQLTSSENEQLSFLSRYPHIAKKIEKDQKLQSEFFNWIFKDQKSAREFLQKNGWSNLDMKPQEIFTSDDFQFGGQGRMNASISLIKDLKDPTVVLGYKVQIPPLSTVFISEN